MPEKFSLLYDFYIELIKCEYLSIESRSIIHFIFTKFKREKLEWMVKND